MVRKPRTPAPKPAIHSHDEFQADCQECIAERAAARARREGMRSAYKLDYADETKAEAQS